MKRAALLVSSSLVVGIALGVIGTGVLTAQQESVKRTVLLKTDLVGIEGKEAFLGLTEYAPGASSGKHYHPSHTFLYVLEGSGSWELEGQPPVTRKQGGVIYEQPKLVHNIKNASTTAPLKLLACVIGEKGQPRTVPVK